jgi:hypothetical protein
MNIEARRHYLGPLTHPNILKFMKPTFRYWRDRAVDEYIIVNTVVPSVAQRTGVDL